MPNQTWDERPVALIVEDVPGTLDSEKFLFGKNGFYPVGAGSLAEALRELGSGPSVDFILTDIGLNPNAPDRDSGYDLLREVRKQWPDLPVVGYSARDDDDHGEEAGFTEYLPKSKTAIIADRIPEWRIRALKYKRSRLTRAKAELRRLQLKYSIPERDTKFLRDFLPGDRVGASSIDGGEELPKSPDDLLREAGYSLHIIDPGTSVPDSGEPPVRTALAIPVWKRSDEGVVIAELYGHPSIYVAGESLKETIEGLLVLMFDYHATFRERTPDKVGPSLSLLHEYLSKVFE